MNTTEKLSRSIELNAIEGDESLGPLSLLPGVWANEPSLRGRGWNLIALPFAAAPFRYRLLMNQYNETLKFNLVDKNVPNRGIEGTTQTDQKVFTLDYDQSITQIAADDFPPSGEAGGPDLAIHREPGLWLHMKDQQTNGVDIGRLATIPHGDSVLALGRSAVHDGPPEIPEKVSALPIGGDTDLTNPYLEPYKHFEDNPFVGELGPGFPGFLPTDTTNLLKLANEGVNIKRTTVLDVDTAVETGGIVNIPFIVKQANAAEMKSTFWIQELDETDANGKPVMRLQYLQTVILDFFMPRPDGMPGAIRWPHISINTLLKVEH